MPLGQGALEQIGDLRGPNLDTSHRNTLSRLSPKLYCSGKLHGVHVLGIVQKVFSEKKKGVGNSKNASEIRQKCVRNASEMRQKCVRNASEMRQKCVKMGLVLLGKDERSKMRQKCGRNASKMRGTPLGENTLWTIPTIVQASSRVYQKHARTFMRTTWRSLANSGELW